MLLSFKLVKRAATCFLLPKPFHSRFFLTAHLIISLAHFACLPNTSLRLCGARRMESSSAIIKAPLLWVECRQLDAPTSSFEIKLQGRCFIVMCPNLTRVDKYRNRSPSRIDILASTYMPSAPAARNDLISPIFPQMQLSDKSNPLTRPHSTLSSGHTPAEHAVERFSVKGNAIGGCIRVKCADLGIE